MHVQIQFGLKARIQPQRGGPRPNDGKRGLDRFLHDVAQLAGQRQLALARRDRGLDAQQLAADLRPGQALGLAHPVLVFGAAVAELAHPEVRLELAGADADFPGRGTQQLPLDDLAADPRDLPLQVAHSGLAGVVANDVAQAADREAKLVLAHAVILHLLGDQVIARDGQLLVLGVAGNPQDFHAVEQRRRYGQRIGRANEHHARQIEIDLQVVVVEGGILFRVQDLQQRRGRVAAKVHGHLVHLIEQEQRVAHARPRQVLDDLARQRADIGATVAAYFRLVAHAAQRHAHKGAVGGPGDRTAQGRLADAGRTDQTQDGPLQRPNALLHRQVLEDALLDLLQSVVVLFQYPFGTGQVAVGATLFLPGHLQQPVQVIAHHGGLGRHRRHHLELAQLGHCLFLSLLGHAGFLDPLFHGGNLVGRLVELAQLLLDGLHLFVQVVLALALLHLRLHAAANLALDLEHVDLAAHEAHQIFHALARISGLQHDLLLLERKLHVRGNRVGQPAGVVQPRHAGQRFGRNVLVQLHVRLELAQQRAAQRFHFVGLVLPGGLFRDGLELRAEELA